MNNFIIGNYKDITLPKDISLVIADPVYDTSMVNDIVELIFKLNVPGIVFSSINDLYNFKRKPEQTCFWMKQPSTKNTVKNYSQFCEAITFYNGIKFYKQLHWTTRTGIFLDQLIDNTLHPWKKPESLIEKLLLNHYKGEGIVLDPCAGSGTVHDVCTKLNIPSFSIELDEKYKR